MGTGGCRCSTATASRTSQNFRHLIERDVRVAAAHQRACRTRPTTPASRRSIWATARPARASRASTSSRLKRVTAAAPAALGAADPHRQLRAAVHRPQRHQRRRTRDRTSASRSSTASPARSCSAPGSDTRDEKYLAALEEKARKDARRQAEIHRRSGQPHRFFRRSLSRRLRRDPRRDRRRQALREARSPSSIAEDERKLRAIQKPDGAWGFTRQRVHRSEGHRSRAHRARAHRARRARLQRLAIRPSSAASRRCCDAGSVRPLESHRR